MCMFKLSSPYYTLGSRKRLIRHFAMGLSPHFLIIYEASLSMGFGVTYIRVLICSVICSSFCDLH